MNKLNQATKRMANLMREHPELKAEFIAYVNLISKYVSEVEMENLHLETSLSEMIKNEKTLLSIMEGYGIDLSDLGSRSRYALLSHIAMGQRGIFLIPEKLRTYVKYPEQ